MQNSVQREWQCTAVRWCRVTGTCSEVNKIYHEPKKLSSIVRHQTTNVHIILTPTRCTITYSIDIDQQLKPRTVDPGGMAMAHDFSKIPISTQCLPRKPPKHAASRLKNPTFRTTHDSQLVSYIASYLMLPHRTANHPVAD